ncbi:MAG: class I adenylate-forming enzyme family protein [Thermomicrobiales bacterium]
MTACKRVETLIDDAAARRPDHAALVFAGRVWTYAAVRAEMDRRAALLVAAGLAPGDVVATTVQVSDDYALAFLACCRADLTLFHASSKVTAAELQPLAAKARVKMVLTADGQPHPALPSIPALPIALPGEPSDASRAEARRRSSEGDAEAVACLQLTSGTTGGMPKLVMTPHRFFTWNADHLPWWMTADGVYYTPRPSVLATRTVAEVCAIGGTMVLSVATRPETIEEEMAVCGATALWTTPSILHLLAELAHPPPTRLALRYARFGAALLPETVARGIAARYHVPLINEFGSTEGGSLLGTPSGGAPTGSIGLPYQGVTARVVDTRGVDVPDGTTGELILQTPACMVGYAGDPDATARTLRDGWLWTGDLVRRDAHGFLFYEGREALRINVGGFKVSPDEVEAVLLAHPQIREAVVVAMPDVARGEVVRAIIVPGESRPTAGELRRYCRARLAGYKVPRRFEFRDALPRSSLGKVLRHLL